MKTFFKSRSTNFANIPLEIIINALRSVILLGINNNGIMIQLIDENHKHLID